MPLRICPLFHKQNGHHLAPQVAQAPQVVQAPQVPRVAQAPQVAQEP